MSSPQGYDQLDAASGRVQIGTTPPQTPAAYYGASVIARDEWRGGELFYHNGTGTGGHKLYIQTATSGSTPVWRTTTTQWTAV